MLPTQHSIVTYRHDVYEYNLVAWRLKDMLAESDHVRDLWSNWLRTPKNFFRSPLVIGQSDTIQFVFGKWDTICGDLVSHKFHTLIWDKDFIRIEFDIS